MGFLPGSDQILCVCRLDLVDMAAPQGQQVKYAEITRSGWVQVMKHGAGVKGGDKHSITSFIEDVKQRFRLGSLGPLQTVSKSQAQSRHPNPQIPKSPIPPTSESESKTNRRLVMNSES